MAKKTRACFNLKSICEIIRVAGSANVAELKFGDLHVRFHPQGSPRQAEPQADYSFFPSSPAEMGPTLDSSEEKVQIDPEVAQQFADMQALIDDPASFESEQIDRMIYGPKADHEETRHRRAE